MLIYSIKHDLRYLNNNNNNNYNYSNNNSMNDSVSSLKKTYFDNKNFYICFALIIVISGVFGFLKIFLLNSLQNHNKYALFSNFTHYEFMIMIIVVLEGVSISAVYTFVVLFALNYILFYFFNYLNFAESEKNKKLNKYVKIFFLIYFFSFLKFNFLLILSLLFGAIYSFIFALNINNTNIRNNNNKSSIDIYNYVMIQNIFVPLAFGAGFILGYMHYYIKYEVKF